MPDSGFGIWQKQGRATIVCLVTKFRGYRLHIYMTINLPVGETFQQIHVFLFWLTKFLKGFDDGLVTFVMLIYLQKAFDMINHDKLLKKLGISGFSDHTVKWFQSYLSNGKCTVNSKNFFSEVSSILCNVPHGPILSPLWFLIYVVNDMPMTVKFNLFLYADDPCLVFQSKNVKDIEKQLN